MGKLTLSTITMCSNSDKERNLEKAYALVKETSTKGADWVLLPEIFNYHGGYDRIYENGSAEGEGLYDLVKGWAKEFGISLIAGSIGERAAPGLQREEEFNEKGERRVYNTSYVFDKEGEEIAKYRKTHLFNLYEDDGTPLYCESDGFIPGDNFCRFNLDGYEVGLVICYDLRFPEVFLKMTEDKPLDVIIIPSAFTLKTGMAHWEVLLRARAIEHQCYVYSSNQCGVHRPGKESYGHSMIIDPWGIKIADTGDSEGVASASICKERIEEVRAKLPALKNRRPELY